MPDDELYKQLDSKLERVYEAIQRLAVNRHVFEQVQNLIRNNPAIQEPSTFYDWMSQMYIEAMTAAIRRLVDHRKGSISFVRLLETVRRNPACFSRSAYKSRCTKTHLPEGYIDRDYDRLIGEGRHEPDPCIISAEIKALEKQTAILKRFVDERVAHSAREQTLGLPTFQDMDDAIDALEALFRRYLHLLRGVWLARVLPTWTYDWEEIFTTPWTPSGEYNVNILESTPPSKDPQSS